MWGDTEQDALIVAQIDAHTEFIREALWGQGETYHATTELCSDIRLRSEFYHGTCSSTQAVTSMESFMIALLVPELGSKCPRGLRTRCVQTLRSMVTSCVSTDLNRLLKLAGGKFFVGGKLSCAVRFRAAARCQGNGVIAT